MRRNLTAEQTTGLMRSLNYYKVSLDHPLLKGVNDFTVEEEPYMLEFDSFLPINVMLEFEYRENRYPADWEHTYGLGKVVYLQLGHNRKSFQSTDYRKLVRNSVIWASV